MSLKRVLRMLQSLGFSEMESQVYIYLAKKGPLQGDELVSALKLTRHQLYSVIHELLDKGVVTAIPERTVKFSAMSLEKVLDLFLKEKMNQAEALQTSREELISSWRSMFEIDFEE